MKIMNTCAVGSGEHLIGSKQEHLILLQGGIIYFSWTVIKTYSITSDHLKFALVIESIQGYNFIYTY